MRESQEARARNADAKGTTMTWDVMKVATQVPYGSRVMRTQKERPYDIGKVEK